MEVTYSGFFGNRVQRNHSLTWVRYHITWIVPYRQTVELHSGVFYAAKCKDCHIHTLQPVQSPMPNTDQSLIFALLPYPDPQSME